MRIGPYLSWLYGRRPKATLASEQNDLNRKILEAFNSIFEKGASALNTERKALPVLEAIPRYNGALSLPTGKHASASSAVKARDIADGPSVDIFKRNKLSVDSLHKNVYILSNMLSPTGRMLSKQATTKHIATSAKWSDGPVRWEYSRTCRVQRSMPAGFCQINKASRMLFQGMCAMDYVEPEWSQPLEGSMTVECFKAGTVAGTVEVPPSKKFIFIGRLPDNDLSLEHESVSRRHAVLQFGPKGQAFLYDLNSTHGTFVNKQRIPPVKYVEIRPGNDQFSLGASTRTFCLHFEPEDGSSLGGSPGEDHHPSEKGIETEDDVSISSSSSDESDIHRRKKALTAEDLRLMLEDAEAEVLSNSQTLASGASLLAELKEASADDFDAYILSLRKDELEQDVEKYTKRLEEAQQRRNRIVSLLAIVEPDFDATSRSLACSPPALEACEAPPKLRESHPSKAAHLLLRRTDQPAHALDPSDNDSGDDESASKLAEAYGY